MSRTQFQIAVSIVALAFTIFFLVIVIPPLIDNPDIVGAFAAGFVNPYSSGYSADVVASWLILAVWVFYEARAHHVKRGWVCLLLGVVPGVAVGFAAYLVLRNRE